MAYGHDRSVAATAQLEGWRLPVGAALQPVLVVDDALRVVAASPAASRLLVLAQPGRPLVEALGLRDVADDWPSTPFARGVTAAEPQRERVELPTQSLALDVVVNPLFGTGGVIGALVFLTAV